MFAIKKEGDRFLCLKADLMHVALTEICTAGMSWRQIKAVDRYNPEPFPPCSASHNSLSVFVNAWKRLAEAKQWLILYAHTSNHCHQSKKRRKASKFRRRDSTVESVLQIIFIFTCPKFQAFLGLKVSQTFLIIFSALQALNNQNHVCFIICVLFCMKEELIKQKLDYKLIYNISNKQTIPVLKKPHNPNCVSRLENSGPKVLSLLEFCWHTLLQTVLRAQITLGFCVAH